MTRAGCCWVKKRSAKAPGLAPASGTNMLTHCGGTLTDAASTPTGQTDQLEIPSNESKRDVQVKPATDFISNRIYHELLAYPLWFIYRQINIQGGPI